MNETIKTLKSRRSIRSYSEKQVSVEVIEKILEVGTYAPTAMNRQSPIIIAVQNRDDRDALSELNKKVRKMGKDPYYGAPTIILVLASGGCLVEDGSLVLGNMMNAAHSLGVATCWINGVREMFADEDGKVLLRKWGIDESFVGVGSLAVGYANGEYPEAGKRKENYTYMF